jgi:hypothetical protein
LQQVQLGNMLDLPERLGSAKTGLSGSETF